MKVKASEELFHAWKTTGAIIAQSAAIVQNDMDITDIDIKTWLIRLDTTKKEIEDLTLKTISYLYKWS